MNDTVQLFHVTDKANLPGIMENGIEPRIGPRSALFGEQEPLVYMFASMDDVDQAMMGWLGDSFEDDESTVVITINLTKDAFGGCKVVEYEVQYPDTIKPEWLGEVNDI